MIAFRRYIPTSLIVIAMFVPAPVRAEESDNRVLVEAVQSLAGTQLYQAYLAIELLAEVRPYGVLEASELAYQLRLAVEPLEDCEKHLAKVGSLKGLSREDAARLGRLRKVAGLLQSSGKSLQHFWDSGVSDYNKDYETARKAAYKELDDMLDLNPKKGAAPPPREPGMKK
jgi:hypothetical protein